MVGGLGTPTHGAVVDFLNDEGVPDLFVSSGSLQWGEDPEKLPWTFGWQTDYESEGKVIGKYVAENMPDAKVGLFLQDDDFGADGEKGLRQYLEDQIVETQRYTSGNTDVAPQVSALQVLRGRPGARVQHPVVHRADQLAAASSATSRSGSTATWVPTRRSSAASWNGSPRARSRVGRARSTGC